MRSGRVLAWCLFWILFLGIGAEALLARGIPWRFANLEPYLLYGPSDAWTHTTFLVHQLKNRQRPQKLFISLGGSATLEAVTEDEDVSRALSEAVSEPVEFVTLASSHKTFGDEAKIAEALGAVGATVLIPLDILSFTKRPEDQLIKKSESGALPKYYGFSAPAKVHEILASSQAPVSPTGRIRVFQSMLHFGNAFKAALKRVATGGALKVEYRRHALGDMIPIDEAAIERHNQWLPEELEALAARAEVNLQLLEVAVDILTAHRNRVVLVDLPTNPIFDHHLRPQRPVYDRLVAQLVAKKGIGYLDLRRKVQLSSNDFNDFHHLRRPGREKFTAALAAVLSRFATAQIAASEGTP